MAKKQVVKQEEEVNIPEIHTEQGEEQPEREENVKSTVKVEIWDKEPTPHKLVRFYTEESHGKDFLSLAAEFLTNQKAKGKTNYYFKEY